MVGPLQRVLVCPPRAAGWDMPAPVRTLAGAGISFIHQISPSRRRSMINFVASCDPRARKSYTCQLRSDLSLDAVYTHDPSLATDHGLIGLNPGNQTGFPKRSAMSNSAAALAFRRPDKFDPPGKTEAGDMVWLDSTTLLIGHGYRTNAAGIAQMRELLRHTAWK